MSVYFIRVGRYFKIGASDDPQRRFERLHQGGTRYTFPTDASLAVEDRELYKVVDGWKDRERAVHRQLEDFAVGLEWFLDEPEVRAFIDALPAREHDRVERRARVVRPGGDAIDEYLTVQAGRSLREEARFLAKRQASA